MQLADLGERGLISRIQALASSVQGRSVVLGIGDDAALLRPRRGQDVAVTSDALVQGVHFRFDHESPRSIGRRALVANLSDLAAMGARPLGFTLALAAPPRLEVAPLLGVLRGLLVEAAATECPLVGGNVSRARELSLVIAALGSVGRGRALRRDGARVGDRLLVTGVLGAAALARARARREGLQIRHRPVARLQAGRLLARTAGIHACIDISDGLLADLDHLLTASGVGAEIDAARVPRARGLAARARALGIQADRLVLEGGEDYELLFAAAARAPSAALLARRCALPIREIGRVTRRGLRLSNTQLRRGSAGGWQHF